MLFIFVVPEIYLVAPILVIIGVTCLGSSFVVLNSFLPLLAGNHPTVHETDGKNHPSANSMEMLSPGSRQRESSEHHESHRVNGLYPARRKTDSLALKVSTEISSKGVGIGYTAALFVQLLSILLLYLMSKTNSSSTLAVRMVLLFVGLWWFCGTIPAYLYLRDRPGPPLKSALSKGNKLTSCLAYVVFAWSSLWTTIKIALRLPQVIVFLVAVSDLLTSNGYLLTLDF
jgi:UMF1 family MFS transporter